MRFLFIWLVLSAGLAACSSPVGEDRSLHLDRRADGADNVIAIVNADAHTATPAGRIEGATILIESGRISAIGADVAVPDHARVIDAQGRPVTPGLISSATQLGLVEVSSSQDTVDRSESAGRVGAAFDIRYGLNFNSTLIPIARADGLTHGVVVPSASAEAPFAGIGAVINVGSSEDLLERAGIAMFANLDSQGTSGGGQSRSAAWIVLRQALAAARDGVDADASDLGTVLSNADLRALIPVVEASMPLVIRARRESDIRQAVALADDFGLRLVLFEANEAWRAADLLAARGTPVILDPTDNLPQRFDGIGSRLENAALLHAAGVPLGFYASGLQMSHNVGLELRQNAGIAVANGLPWAAALEAVTAGAARIWGMDDHLGALAQDKVADLVVWSGDPFEVTTEPLVVLVDGSEVSLDTRQKQLRDRYHPDRLKSDAGAWDKSAVGESDRAVRASAGRRGHR